MSQPQRPPATLAPTPVVAPAEPRSPAPPSAAGGSGLLDSVLRLVRMISGWDLAALIGGGVGAGLWYGWSAMDVKDTKTPFLIMLLPVAIVVFRKPIDALLRPLQKIKDMVPRWFLIGVGLATPYLVANFFYHQMRIQNFPLAQKSIIWGTLLSYVIMRIPQPAVLRNLSRKPFATLGILGWIWFMTGAAQLILAGTASADDFGRDKRRLEDALRTDGWAQVVAGTAATVISGLVNGALIFQRPTRKPPGEDSGEEETRYTMDVRTEGERTQLIADGEDRLWIYAQISCNKPSVDSRALTQAIGFSFGGSKYADWMKTLSTQFTGGYKAVLVAAKPPTENAEVEEGATVTVNVSGRTADGEEFEVPVKLDLSGELKLDLEVLE
ncbi:MAG: hypothetical protein HZC54_12125 [Verrucomicrobia bacterium]|nr:hypothetical protein [Verrucomicrobiota bacterium]